MPDPSTIFAWIVTVLAGLAVIGALAVVIVAEVYAIRRTLERHRSERRAVYVRPSREGLYWRERSAVTVPETDHETVRDGARRILAGESPRHVALDPTKPQP
jgi:hypothetical protein